MRIAIFGVGGAGGYFGAKLISAGEEVVFIARGRHLDVIRERGLCVSSTQGEMLVRPMLATDDSEEAGEVDVVILGVKAAQVVESAMAMRAMLGKHGFVVPLQNGVEAAPQLCDMLGAERVIGGLCGTLSWVSAPGHIRSLGDANFIRFGELDNRPSPRTRALHDAFDAAGVNVEIPQDINRALWEKFLFVVSVGGVAALQQETIGQMRASPESRRMLELSMQEIAALAAARGIVLGGDVVARTITFVDRLPEDGTTSLQRDLRQGKPSELDAWTGAVVRLAQAAGIPTPVNGFIYDSLRKIESRACTGRE